MNDRHPVAKVFACAVGGTLLGFAGAAVAAHLTVGPDHVACALGGFWEGPTCERSAADTVGFVLGFNLGAFGSVAIIDWITRGR